VKANHSSGTAIWRAGSSLPPFTSLASAEIDGFAQAADPINQVGAAILTCYIRSMETLHGKSLSLY
jgi:hypothetical protein